MAVTIGSARIDEHGKISGGKAGDQNSNENLQKLADTLKEYLQ